MRIDSISMKNFRKFEEIQICLKSNMNVIAGNNGSGKSSILDALSIGIGGFFLGISRIETPGIKRTDIRYETYMLGSRPERQPKLPVSIRCTGTVFDKDISWTRSLNTETGKTAYGEASTINKIGKRIESHIHNGNANVILPIISYYGTGRLWAQHKDTFHNNTDNYSSRFDGYVNCLSSKSNESAMIRWFRDMTMIALEDNQSVPELTAVQDAIAKCFFGGYSNAKDFKVRYSVKRKGIEVSYINKDGQPEIHPFHELSDGFRNTLSMVADIAYRMAMLNPQLLSEVTRKTPGVVLIDEVDLHLHPQWQKNILNNLQEIFPMVQFVVTTHSPTIIASAKNTNLIMIDGNDCYYYDSSYGKDSNSVMTDIMQVEPRPEEVKVLFDRFHQAIDRRDLTKAEAIYQQLADILGENDRDVVNARIALEFESF